jgi:hypothetical protein
MTKSPRARVRIALPAAKCARGRVPTVRIRSTANRLELNIPGGPGPEVENRVTATLVMPQARRLNSARCAGSCAERASMRTVRVSVVRNVLRERPPTPYKRSRNEARFRVFRLNSPTPGRLYRVHSGISRTPSHGAQNCPFPCDSDIPDDSGPRLVNPWSVNADRAACASEAHHLSASRERRRDGISLHMTTPAHCSTN